MSTLITYKIVEDRDDKLKIAARMACNFWNHYIEPETSIVIHIDLFRSPFRYIARSYEPERRGTVTHGRIRFNTVYVKRYTELQLAGTLVHELGHTLGFGWDRWMQLFDAETGRFTEVAVGQLPALAQMWVETDHDEATQYLHWDEGRHRGELMTGFENKTEHVLPVSIDVMQLLGHKVERRLQAKAPIKTLLQQLEGTPFARKAEARQLTGIDFKPTRIWERIFERMPDRATTRKTPPRAKGGRSLKGKRF